VENQTERLRMAMDKAMHATKGMYYRLLATYLGLLTIQVVTIWSLWGSNFVWLNAVLAVWCLRNIYLITDSYLYVRRRHFAAIGAMNASS
jgi:hypothetical protein